MLRDFLSASGYTVIEAVDGAESVVKAASEHPDLMLMDIQLPPTAMMRHSRSACCPALRQSQSLQSVPLP
jgi:CheY-like chemotaxis protein